MGSGSRKSGFGGGMLFGMLIGGLAAAGGFLAGNHEAFDAIFDRSKPSDHIEHRLGGGDLPSPTLHAPSGTDGEAPSVRTIADIARQTMPGVVNISTKRTAVRRSLFDESFLRLWGVPRERSETSLGSGVIVSESGVVLTNNHVVEGADEIFVTLADGKQTYQAELVGSDASSDLAVLRLPKGIEGLKPITLGDSNRLRVGDWVIAVGNPFGVGQTVTHGIVSALGRANVGIMEYEDFIQTDAAINPGNSGGALINMEGELIGINTAILSRSGGSQGVGFAIPSNMVKPIADNILKNGKLVRGWLGVSVEPIDMREAERMGRVTSEGVKIVEITEESPAERAGLQPDDLLLTLNGQIVNSPQQLRSLIATYGADAEVSFGVWRDGEELMLSGKLDALTDAFARVESIAVERGTLAGLQLAEIDDLTREKYELDQRTSGVVIVAVERGSSAQRAGIAAGDIVTWLNGGAIESLSDFESAYDESSRGLDLRLNRKGMQLSLTYR